MDNYERSNRRARLVLIVPTVVFLALILLVTGVIKLPPSINKYKDKYGFSLDGVKVKITAYDSEPAFQDPWNAYVAEVSGERAGTLFDPAEFSKDPGQKDVTEVIKLIFLEMSGHEKGLIFDNSRTDRFEYRTLIYRDKVSVKRQFLYVIHDLEADNYCIISGNTIT
jgi:hypothetical protein